MKTKKQLSAEMKLKTVQSYKKGKNPDEISSILGISKRTMYRWVKQHQTKKSFKNDDADTRGRPSKLDDEDSDKLLQLIKKPATSYGFETNLWNTTRLKIICKKELNIKLSKMAIWRFLKKFNQSFKTVQKQYYETKVRDQNKWIKNTLKEIKRTIRKHRAIMYFEDESSIQLSPVMGKSWGPIGKKIVSKVTGNRGSIAAISAISNDGRLLFNLFDKSKRFNSDDIILFLKQILDHHPRRHIVIIMDRASCHISKKVKFFEEHQKRLHVFHLPARSPKLNPDEQVWAHLKNHDLKSHTKTNIKDLKALTRKKLNNLKNDCDKVRRIFKRCEMSHLYQR